MRRLILGICEVDLDTGALRGGQGGHLTTGELGLLRYLAGRPGQTVSRETLLTEVLGYVPQTRTRAVDKSMFNLRVKVEADSTAPEHLVTVQGVGYKFVPRRVGSVALPPEREPLQGRGGELEALQRWLGEPALVTLKGPGGVGKSRLALRAAWAWAEQGDVAVFCELGPVSSREGWLQTMARACGIALGELDPADQLGEALARRGRLLLVLDNLEQLVPHADLIEILRERAPELRLLVTSRVSLEMPGEQVVRVEPLPRPDSVVVLCARAAARGLALDPDDPALDALAERLDDLPLALELAAAQLGMLSPAALVRRLQVRPVALRSGQGSLRDMFDHSWDLLDGPCKTALAQLSVFAGPFELEAAEGVLSPPTDGRDLVEVIDALERASLLQRTVHEGLGHEGLGHEGLGREGVVRLGLLQLVRAYASERLAALGDGEIEARDAHMRYYAERSGPDVLASLHGPRACEILARLTADLDELVAACRHALARGHASQAARFCFALSDLLAFLGRFHDPLLLELASAAMGIGLPPALEARVSLLGLDAPGDLRDTIRIFERACALAEESGDALAQGESLCVLGWARYRRGQHEAARALIERGIALLEGTPAVAHYRVRLSNVILLQDRASEAFELARAVSLDARRRGDLIREADASLAAAASAQQLDELEEAELRCRRALRCFEELGATGPIVLYTELTLSRILSQASGRGEVALEHLLSLEQRCADAGLRVLADTCTVNVAALLGGLGRLDEAQAKAEEGLARAEISGSLSELGRALWVRGRTSLMRGELARAIADLERALDKGSPRDTSFRHAALAEALWRSGREQQALEHLVRARETAGGLPYVDRRLEAELQRISALLG